MSATVKDSGKSFGDSQCILRLFRLTRAKIVNFRPKFEISESDFGQNFCMWVSDQRQKEFLSPASGFPKNNTEKIRKCDFFFSVLEKNNAHHPLNFD